MTLNGDIFPGRLQVQGGGSVVSSQGSQCYQCNHKVLEEDYKGLHPLEKKWRFCKLISVALLLLLLMLLLLLLLKSSDAYSQKPLHRKLVKKGGGGC